MNFKNCEPRAFVEKGHNICISLTDKVCLKIPSSHKSYVETSSLYSEEQNGFRKNRSCEDHLFILSSIIRNRKRERLSTYIAFVDFVNSVDRNLLFFKLKSMGFDEFF